MLYNDVYLDDTCVDPVAKQLRITTVSVLAIAVFRPEMRESGHKAVAGDGTQADSQQRLTSAKDDQGGGVKGPAPVAIIVLTNRLDEKVLSLSLSLARSLSALLLFCVPSAAQRLVHRIVLVLF